MCMQPVLSLRLIDVLYLAVFSLNEPDINGISPTTAANVRFFLSRLRIPVPKLETSIVVQAIHQPSGTSFV